MTKVTFKTDIPIVAITHNCDIRAGTIFTGQISYYGASLFIKSDLGCIIALNGDLPGLTWSAPKCVVNAYRPLRTVTITGEY